MKVDPKTTVAAAATTKAQPFKQLLAEAKAELGKDKKPPVPIAPRSATVSTRPVVQGATVQSQQRVVVQQQTLQRARAHVEGEAQRLGNVRGEHAKTAEGLQQVSAQHVEANHEKREARLIDFIVRELTAEERPSTTPRVPEATSAHHLQPTAGGAQPQPKLDAPPEAKAAQAVALIEKIEVFVKSQRPGLALTLNNSLGAHVEIERIGPKEIALKLVGHRGPPTAEAVSRIREELRARGLKVGALSVA